MPAITFKTPANNVSSALQTALTNNATTVQLAPGGGAAFPNAPFYCSCEFEVMQCTSKASDTLTVIRGQDNTTASAHVVGSIVEIRNNAALWIDAYNGVNQAIVQTDTLTANITNKSALPSDTVYTGSTQSLTNKTLDLINGNNTIIGNVSPDPSQLVYQNLWNNGGFEEWAFPTSTTLAAGAPASGGRAAPFTNFWGMFGYNDSAITCTRDTANTDPSYPSNVDLQVNVNTVQANDTVGIYNANNIDFTSQDSGILGQFDILKLLNNPISVTVRAKLTSGNPQMRIRLTQHTYNGVDTSYNSAWFTLTSSYATYRWENQIVIQSTNASGLELAIDFKGVGVCVLDNVMGIIGAVGTTYRPIINTIPRPLNNLLANGGFEVWQRGAGPFTNNKTTNVVGPDRWVGQLGSPGNGVLSVTRENSNIDANSQFSAALNYTSADVNDGTPGMYYALTDMEAQYNSRIMTFSARVKAGISGVRIWGLTTGNVRVFSLAHPGDNQWHTLTVTWQYVLGQKYVGIQFTPGTGGLVYIDNCTLVAGNIPGVYVAPNQADDLARCMRYYEILGNGTGSGNPFQLSGYGGANQTWRTLFALKAWMVNTPTITKNGTWTVVNANQPTIGAGDMFFATADMQVISANTYGYAVATAAGQNITVEYNP